MCQGLPTAERASLYGKHRGHPCLPGRVYTRYQTTWCAHGAQPAGTCTNLTSPLTDSRLFLTWSKTSVIWASRVDPRAIASSKCLHRSVHYKPHSSFTSMSCPASGGLTVAMWRCFPAVPRRWAWFWWDALCHTCIHKHILGAGVGQGSAHRHVSLDVSVGSWGASGLQGRWATALGAGLLGFFSNLKLWEDVDGGVWNSGCKYVDVIVVPLCNLVPLIHSSACLTNLMFLVSFIFHLFHKFYTNTIVFFFWWHVCSIYS